MGNKRVVGEGSQSVTKHKGSAAKVKSKWFSRLMVLAMGLVLSVGGILGAVLFVSDSKQSYELGEANVVRARDMQIGDYIQNFGGRKWRVIGFDTDGSVTGQVGAPLLRTDSLEPPHSTLLGDRRGNRFHSTNENFWATSELRSFLNSRADLGAGDFTSDGFLSNFTAREQAAIIPNVRLETTRSSALNNTRYQSALAAGQIEAIVGRSAFAPSPAFPSSSFSNWLENTHDRSHIYVHRDTVFILCMHQTLLLNNLGLRYGNRADDSNANNPQFIEYNFMWARARNTSRGTTGYGNADSQVQISWLRSPGANNSVTFLSPRNGVVHSGGASEAFVSSGMHSGLRSFAPALYISPDEVFNVARQSAVSRNEQEGFRVFQFTGPSTPTNLRINGSTISWNRVAEASGFQIRLGTTVVHTLAFATSFNLENIPVAYLAGGTTHTNINVVAMAGSQYSNPSNNVSWARVGTLGAPTNVSVTGSNLVFTGVAYATNYRIYAQRLNAGNWYYMQTINHSGAPTAQQSFDVINWANTNDRDGTRLSVGNNRLRVVAVSTNVLWNDSAATETDFVRGGAVHSVTISGTQNLTVAWPRPDSVGGMPTGQLSASIVQVYGTNSGVTWSSVNPDIVSVDALSGAIHAAWPSGMSMWELSQRTNQFTLIQAVSSVGGVVAEFRVDVFFQTPPVPVVAGISVSGGVRAFEVAHCGTQLVGGGSLSNATQFVATAFGYNLAGAGNVFTWASSETDVATIDAEGRLTVRGVGITRITAISSVGNVPYAFYVTIVRDGTAVATGVSIFCDNDEFVERRIGIIPGDSYGFIEMRAVIEGYNITNQLVTWTSSCGAAIGNPSEFLSMSLTESGIRLTGRSTGGPFIITATPVGAVGAVGTFRIFVYQLIEPEVTNVSVAMPSISSLVIPLARPILTADLPSVQLIAAVSGVGGAAASNVIWTSSCGAKAGFGVENIQGQFVAFVLNTVNPNIVTVIALDRGQTGFTQAVTITATSVITSSVYDSREISVKQAAVTGINLTTAVGGQTEATLIIPYGYTDINARGSIDLRALVSVSHASISQEIRWVVCTQNIVILDNKHTIAQGDNLISALTLRPVSAGVVTVRAVGVLCGTVSNEFTLEIVEECRTSVRIKGPIVGVFGYEMYIVWPRPDDISLPVAQLWATVGGSFARASSLVWTSSCGGDVVVFLGSNVGNIVMLRAVGEGVVTITATQPDTEFVGTFIVAVDKARLENIEILGDGVVREHTAMLIPLVYNDGVYTLSDVAQRQMLELSLGIITHGDVTTDFVWTSSDNSVVRILGTYVCYETGDVNAGKITDRNGFIAVLPYGVGTAVIRATATADPRFYAEFTIFVTRGTASCVIQDGILDLPIIQEGYVRIILVCEHYFGGARMSHQDLSLQYALEFVLPQLEVDIYGAIFFGWSLSRGGNTLQPCPETEQLLLPLHMLDLEAGLDTLLLFAVWYIPYVPSESNGSNLARNIIIGTLSVAGVGAAGTAGYIAQSKIRARRKSEANEWGLDN
ncbi:MAG: hypothetical protein FWB72_04400 [Firmicutes bacterium]|nr:hypothetical protein [Bacillota bacterium]